MKTTDSKINLKKLCKFENRINREACKLFPDGEGGSLLRIHMEDRSRFEPSSAHLPVPYCHLIETDAEWRDALRSLSCNASSAAQRMDVFLQQYDLQKRREEGLKALVEELQALSKKLKTTIYLGAGHSAGVGMRWAKLFDDGEETSTLKPGAVIQIKNLFDYRKEERNALLAWVKALVEKWTRRPSFALSINSDIAHLYVAVPTDQR